eukprot:SAG31_NODE_10134_length_1179_cov_1.232407_2_plen_60_part_00
MSLENNYYAMPGSNVSLALGPKYRSGTIPEWVSWTELDSLEEDDRSYCVAGDGQISTPS